MLLLLDIHDHQIIPVLPYCTLQLKQCTPLNDLNKKYTQKTKSSFCLTLNSVVLVRICEICRLAPLKKVNSVLVLCFTTAILVAKEKGDFCLFFKLMSLCPSEFESREVDFELEILSKMQKGEEALRNKRYFDFGVSISVADPGLGIRSFAQIAQIK